MAKRIKGTVEEKFLRKFVPGRRIDKLQNQQEIKTFEEFQRFDLIRAGAAGIFRITKQGEYALGVGVKRYLTNVRFEKRLFKDYMKAKSQKQWFMILGLLIVLVVLSLFIHFSL